MGLSRNKVAVSEGAAGSPPFYGERDRWSQSDGSVVSLEIDQNQKIGERVHSESEYGSSVVQF